MSLVDGKQVKPAPNGIGTTQINANAVTSAKVDSSVLISSGANPLTGNLNAGSNKIINLATPTLSTDAVTKEYADALSSGLLVKSPALVLGNSNVSLTGEQTIDGVLTSASRVLLTGQTTASQNGLWLTAAGAWVRTADFATGIHAAASIVVIEEGNTFFSEQWVCVTNPPTDIVDTDSLVFTKFAATKGAPRLSKSNKDMTASVTVSDGDLGTATTVVSSNASNGYFGVRVNGISAIVGDGTKTGVDCFLSGDGGTTARAMSAIVPGDTLRWNGSIAGFQLAATDIIDFIYQEFY